MPDCNASKQGSVAQMMRRAPSEAERHLILPAHRCSPPRR